MTKKALRNRINTTLHTKYHVKSYKAKKVWVFAGIFAMLLGAGLMSKTNTHADPVSANNSQDDTSQNNSQPSTKSIISADKDSQGQYHSPQSINVGDNTAKALLSSDKNLGTNSNQNNDSNNQNAKQSNALNSNHNTEQTNTSNNNSNSPVQSSDSHLQNKVTASRIRFNVHSQSNNDDSSQNNIKPTSTQNSITVNDNEARTILGSDYKLNRSQHFNNHNNIHNDDLGNATSDSLQTGKHSSKSLNYSAADSQTINTDSEDNIPFSRITPPNPLSNEAQYQISQDGHILRISNGVIGNTYGFGLNRENGFNDVRHIELGPNVSAPQNSSLLFGYMPSLEDISGSLDTSNVQNMNAMLAGDPNIHNVNFASGWNTSNVTNTNNMFGGDTNLSNINGLSQWDVRNDGNIGNMFKGDSSLSDFTPVINNWEFDNAPVVDGATDNTPQGPDYLEVSQYNTPNANGANYGFTESHVDNSGQAVARFNYVDWANGQDLGTSTATVNKDTVLPESDMQVPSGYQLVDSADDNSPYNNSRDYLPDTYIGANNQSYTIPVLPNNITDYGYWGTAKYTLDNDGILNIANGTLDPTSYDDPDNSALGDDTGLDLNDIKYINLSNVTAPSNSVNLFGSLQNMIGFYGSGLNTSNVISSSFMFNSANSLDDVTGLDNWDLSHDEDMSYMFVDCDDLPSLDLNNWDTSNVETMDSMFSGDSNLGDLKIGNWNTGNVTDMSNMFQGLDQNNYIDDNNGAGDDDSTEALHLGNWDTSKVLSMDGMFQNAQELHQVDMNDWDTRNVINMNSMFHDTNSLRQISIGNHTKLYNINSLGLPKFMGHWYNSNLEPVDLNHDTNPVAGTYTELSNIDNRPVNYYFGTNKVGSGSVQVPSSNTTSATPHDFKGIPAGYEMDPLHPGRVQLNSNGTSNIQVDRTGTWNSAHWDLNDNGRMYIHDGIIGSGDNGQNNPVLAQATGTNPSDITLIEFSNAAASADSSDLFSNLPNVSDINMSGLDVNGVSSTQNMFHNDPTLMNFNDTNFTPSQDTDADDMFSGDSNLKNLDLGNFNNNNVLSPTTFNNTFAGDVNLRSLDLSNANIAGSANNMFGNDNSLAYLNLGHTDNLSNADIPGTWYNFNGHLTNLNANNVGPGTYHTLDTLKKGTIPITYKNQDNDVVGNGTVEGTVGYTEPVNSLSLPSGYHLGSNNPSNLIVNLVGSNPAQVIHVQGNAGSPINVKYQDNGLTVYSKTFTGNVGDAVNISNSLPSKYHVNPGTQTTDHITSYTQNINVPVNNTSISAVIHYLDSNSHKLIRTLVIPDVPRGSNLSSYADYIEHQQSPAHYHFDLNATDSNDHVINGLTSLRVKNSKPINIYETRQSTNNASNSSTPQSPIHPQSPADNSDNEAPYYYNQSSLQAPEFSIGYVTKPIRIHTTPNFGADGDQTVGTLNPGTEVRIYHVTTGSNSHNRYNLRRYVIDDDLGGNNYITGSHNFVKDAYLRKSDFNHGDNGIVVYHHIYRHSTPDLHRRNRIGYYNVGKKLRVLHVIKTGDHGKTVLELSDGSFVTGNLAEVHATHVHHHESEQKLIDELNSGSHRHHHESSQQLLKEINSHQHESSSKLAHKLNREFGVYGHHHNHSSKLHHKRHVTESIRHRHHISRHTAKPIRHKHHVVRHIAKPIQHKRHVIHHVAKPVRHKHHVIHHVAKPVRHKRHVVRHVNKPKRIAVHHHKSVRKSSIYYHHMSKYHRGFGDWVHVKKPLYVHDSSSKHWTKHSRLYRVSPGENLYIFKLIKCGNVTRFRLWGHQFITADRRLVKLL